MRPPRQFFIYIMTNGPKAAILYTGITGDLRRRVWQHKNGLVRGFTSRYNLTCLVYYECFVYPDAAIAREKEIKGWRRSKKVSLVESMNGAGRTYRGIGRISTSLRLRPLSGRSLAPLVKSAGLRDDAKGAANLKKIAAIAAASETIQRDNVSVHQLKLRAYVPLHSMERPAQRPLISATASLSARVSLRF